MMFVKDITSRVIEPSTYKCNLSFSTGIIPVNMKIAKVMPLCKNGEKSVFINHCWALVP